MRADIAETLWGMRPSFFRLPGGNNLVCRSSLFGYGHVAGYLFNKGIMSAPPPPSDSGAASSVPGASINPITGSVQERRPPEPEMTEEEKEAEMEKLFVLFDRLERTGAMPKEQNPIRKAIQEGKMG